MEFHLLICVSPFKNISCLVCLAFHAPKLRFLYVFGLVRFEKTDVSHGSYCSTDDSCNV